MHTKKVLAGLGIFLLFMLFCTVLSRGIYAMMLPQVTLEKPRRSAIVHKVEAVGSVRQSRETAVSTLPGMMVKEVCVLPGDVVTEGQTLFELDLEDLSEQIAEGQREIESQRLQVSTLQHNVELSAEQKNDTMLRAGQDMLDAMADSELALQRALEDEEQAKRELRSLESAMPENGSDDPEYPMWESEWKAQKEIVKAAERASEDARNAKEEALLQAQRDLDDALSQVPSDASLGIARMTLASLRQEQEKLQKLLEEKGVVVSDRDGVITQVPVSVGERTPDGAAVLMADLSQPLFFTVVLDQEQKKYVDPGEEAEISFADALPGKGMKLTVDYLEELAAQPGSYRAVCRLPEGTGVIGQNGTFRTTRQSETFPCCIPLNALYTDANQSHFVYVMTERATILGTEPVAEKRMVEVLDQNESLAAISPGTVGEDEELIVGSTKEFADGEVVRRKEE